jgi:hypothetical protein
MSVTGFKTPIVQELVADTDCEPDIDSGYPPFEILVNHFNGTI